MYTKDHSFVYLKDKQTSLDPTSVKIKFNQIEHLKKNSKDLLLK